MIKKTLWPAVVLAFAFSATAASKPINHNSRLGCRKTFTVPMVKRAVYWTYRGTRDVARRDRMAVARIVRCERFPRSEKYVRRIKHHVITRWKHRRYVFAHPPLSPLALCIISRESGGNPQAINGQYEGEAQWGSPAWAKDGGLQYAPSPLGASAAEQTRVLMNALAMGYASDWTPYDGC